MLFRIETISFTRHRLVKLMLHLLNLESLRGQSRKYNDSIAFCDITGGTKSRMNKKDLMWDLYNHSDSAPLWKTSSLPVWASVSAMLASSPCSCRIKLPWMTSPVRCVPPDPRPSCLELLLVLGPKLYHFDYPAYSCAVIGCNWSVLLCVSVHFLSR